ncbi:MAG TPA: hypothetical protein VF614_14635 [Chthoniobacteraceae bacterium]|jgi:hypothetical protein
MISPRLLLLSACVCAGPAFAAVNIIPQARPATDYTKLSQESPFALATPTAAPVEQTPSVFANLYLGGIARERDPVKGDRDFVTILTRGGQDKPFTLTGSEPNKEGFAIVSIDRSEKVAKSKVTVKKGTEVGVLEFDEMAMQAQARGAGNAQRPMQGQPGQPGVVTLPGNNIPRPNGGNNFRPNGVPRPNGGQPSNNIPRPNGANNFQQNGGNQATNGIPRPGMAPAPGSQPAPFSAQPGGESRRRIRVINAKP